MRRPVALILTVCWPLAAGPARPSYSQDILPIFERHCTSCHSATATMGSLNLETWEGLRQGGNNGPVFQPGKSKESTLYLSVVGQAPGMGRMPFSNDVLPARDAETIRDWIDSGAPGPEAETEKKSARQIYALAWKPDGKTLAAGNFQEVRLYDATGKTEQAVLKGHMDAVRALAWTRDGNTLVAAGGTPGRKGEVKIWSADGSLRHTMTGHADCIYALALSPDGKVAATASYDKLIKLWDVETGKELKTLKDHIDAIYSLAFTPDGKRLVSGAADRSIKVWNPATGERLFTLSESTDGVNSVVISPDGQRIAGAGQDKSIRIWKFDSNGNGATLENSMIAHEDAVLRIAYTRDGKYLISSSADRSLKVFRASDLTEVNMIPKQSDWAFGLDITTDGTRIAIGRMDGSMWVETVDKLVAAPTTKQVAR